MLPPDRVFDGEASRMALGDAIQWQGGSPHQPWSSEWQKFGRELVLALRGYFWDTGLDRKIRDFKAAHEWLKSKAAADFYDQHIPKHARDKRFAVWDG